MSIYDSQTGKSDLAVDDLSMIKRGKTAEELFKSNSSFTPTDAQLAAMNSGITSEKVDQINTNKNNISVLQTSLAVGSGDNAKVLTAIYEGGEGSYAWVTPPGGFVPTEEQLAAINSGINSEGVAQIGTNTNNILNLKTMGQYTMIGATDPNTGNTTFAGLFKLALEDLGLNTSTLHHYIVYVYTEQYSDLLIMYGIFQYNITISHYTIHSSQIAYYADDLLGTLVISSGEDPVKATVRYLD